MIHDDPPNPRAQKRSLATAPFQKLEDATGKDGYLDIIRKCNVPRGHLTRALHSSKVLKIQRQPCYECTQSNYHNHNIGSQTEYPS